MNELALANLGAWVPEIFGDDAEFQKGTGAYRISSKALGRNLEEDLSIHPKGITDWGLDDQGKKGEKTGRHTAIDIVIEHGGAANAKAAAFWLCEKMAIDPASLGWKAGGGGGSDNPEIDRLAQMSRVDYEKARKKAAKELGFRDLGARRPGRANARGGATRRKPIDRDRRSSTPNMRWCSPATRRR